MANPLAQLAKLDRETFNFIVIGMGFLFGVGVIYKTYVDHGSAITALEIEVREQEIQDVMFADDLGHLEEVFTLQFSEISRRQEEIRLETREANQEILRRLDSM